MRVIRTLTAYYPAFHLGDEPRAVRCELHTVEANGRRYVKTPFAMVDAHGEDDDRRHLGRGYYATAEECEAYLAHEYPHWRVALPVMDALCSSLATAGGICGPARVADRCGVSTDAVYRLARGHRSYTRKQVRQAAAVFAASHDPQPHQAAY
jgi:hypothetical protein